MDTLVGSADQLLGATAAARPQLEEALQRLPDALAAARRALTELAGFADQTTPVLKSLRPVTGDLRQIADELSAFADAAGPALTTLEPVLRKGSDLIGAARPVAAELAAAGGDLEKVGKSGRTLAEAFPPDLGNLLDFVRNFAVATAGADGVSHYLRIFVEASGQALDGLSPLSTPVLGQPSPVPGGGVPGNGAPGPPGDRSPLLPGATGPLPAVSDLVSGVGGLLGVAPPGAAVSPAAGDPGSATGLTATQERSLLDYLLGGR
jgi:phospholipid/cholesterol/gamma-HCH transport system substrate-binding protein